MADDIQRTVYKLEIDDSGYIRGVESMSASTSKLVEIQSNANKQLQTNEAALKASSDLIIKAKKDLDAYTGANEVHRKQLEKTFADAKRDNAALAEAVDFSRKIYEKATKAALDFANSSVKAANLVPAGATKVPTAVPLGIQPNVIGDLTNIFKTGDLSGLPEVLAESSAEFEQLREAIRLAEERMLSLNAADQEFIALQEFVAAGKNAIEQYDNAVRLSTVSTTELAESVKAAQLEVERISAVSPSELPAEVAKSKLQFDELAVSVAGATDRLEGMDQSSDEFKALEQVVIAGRAALDSYNEAAGKVGAATKTYRAELAAANLELKKLQESGTATTEQILQQEKRVAALTDAYEKQQARIKVLASDTRALDFGKAAIQGAINGFQVYTSIAVLAGGASEELQKKTLQLFAAMQLLTALEQLSASVKRGSVIATNLQSASLAVYNALLKASETALGRFKIALAATGIGAAILAVGFLVKKIQELGQANDEAARKQKLLNDVVKETAGDYVKAYTEVSKLKDQFELANRGIGSQRDALIEYNKTLGATVGFANSFREAEELLQKNASAYIRITQLKAEANLLLAKSAEANLKLDQAQLLKIDPNLPEFQRKALQKLKDDLVKDAAQDVEDITDLFVTITKKVQSETKVATGKTAEQLLIDALPKKGSVDAAKKLLEDQIADLKTSYGKLSEANTAGRKQNLADQEKLQKQLDGLTGKKPAKGKSIVENTFEQERAELEAALRELRNKESATIETINAEFAAKLEADRLKIQKEIKDKKILGDLTKPLEQQTKTQAGILFDIQVKINDEQKKQALDKLAKEVTDARQKLNDDLKALNEKNTQDSINLIQDDFDRRAQLIAINEERELVAARDNTVKRLEALDLQKALIPLREYQDAKAEITQAGEDQQTNIILKAARDRRVLALDIFKRSLDELQKIADNIDTGAGLLIAEKIKSLSARFLAGKISFQKFQDDLKKIENTANQESMARQLQADKDALAALNLKIAETIDRTTDQYNELLRLKADFEDKIAKATKGEAVAKVETAQGVTSEKTQKILDYASAIGSVADAAIGFWQKANEAEANALDRSISLQERRVDAAQRIAERGNAQYLKAETDRLKQLQVARENAARRDLAINAALQGSQILVGITGAIAKLAGGPLGVAAVIGEIAIIIGALATGFALVKSLQGNQPQFKTGTTYVERGASPRGEDTIPAWLSEGEAVIPEKTNKSYKKAVEAIYHEKVPANVLNEFVENYVSNNKVINKTETTKYQNENLNTYNNFVRNISNVPTSVLNEFISNYISNKTDSIKIPVLDRLVKEVNYSKEIAKTAVANYSKVVNIIHTVKPIAQPNYQRIGEAASIHIQHDSKLAGLLMEQNRLLIENTDVQRGTMRALQKMGVNVNMDRNGIAVSVMEVIDQQRKDSKT